MAASTVMLNPQAPEFQMPSSLFNPHAPEFQPVGQSLRPEAAEFIPMAGGWQVLQAAAEAYQNKQKRQMPYATDEEWEQRISKREKEVETIKSLQSYRLYIEVFPHSARGDDDPKTPDPRDRTVSKRMWKWNVEKWRLQLKSRCVYSRTVLLQCREALAQAGSSPSSTAKAHEPGPTSPSEAAVSEEEAPEGSKEEAKSPTSQQEAIDRRLKTMSLPEPNVTSPSTSKKEAGYKSGAPPSNGAGTFQ